MKEYGGYIELDEFCGNEYYIDCLSLNSGRSCLGYLIERRNIRKIYLPYFLCDTVKETCEKYEVDYEYYHISENFEPIFSKTLDENEYLYVVNFYGQVSLEYAHKLQGRYKNIIWDNAQDFYRKPIDGMDTIYICRKYFGVADGAYLFTKDNFEMEYPYDLTYDRMSFLLGRYEKEASLFYNDYVNNNDYFTNKPIMRTSKLTRNILKAINYEDCKKKRSENYLYLYEKLKKINKLALKKIEGAFAYPLLLDSGKVIREKLIQGKIYIPTLWEDVFNKCDKESLEYVYAQNILPLPIDQRYSLEDMQEICNEINRII